MLNTVSKHKRHKEASFLSEQQWLEGVVESKVASTVNNDSDTRDDEATVQTDEAVRFDRLHVHVNHSIELSLTALANTTYLAVKVLDRRASNRLFLAAVFRSIMCREENFWC